MAKPRRAVRFTASIEADTRQDLANHLYNLASQIERGEIWGPTSISGGPNVGHIIELIQDDGPSHDEYFAQLRAHLRTLDTKPEDRSDG